MGRPIVISENMSSIAQNATSIYFGDFKQAYYLLNRVGATVKVNDQTQYKNGLYEFVLRARFGGNVVQQFGLKYLRHT
jgi:HK97 family phage major capsid protein